MNYVIYTSAITLTIYSTKWQPYNQTVSDKHEIHINSPSAGNRITKVYKTPSPLAYDLQV